LTRSTEGPPHWHTIKIRIPMPFSIPMQLKPNVLPADILSQQPKQAARTAA
jgi:hypothetical protein